MLIRLHPFARFLPALLALVLVACGGSAAMPSAAPTGAPAAGTIAQPANQIPQRQQATTPAVTAAPAAEAPIAAAPTAAAAAPAIAQPLTDQPVVDVAVGAVAQRPTLPPMVEPIAPTASAQTVPVNPFVQTSADQLSTFALDVDTGAYTAARGYINAGRLPPPDSARAEEFLNYFHYDYPVPQQGDFGIYVDAAPSPWGQGDTQIVRVGIQGRRIDDSQRKDAALTFVIDASGSMDRPSRLPLAKQALALLVGELRENDSVAIVVFGSEAHVVLQPTSAAQRQIILQAIDSLSIEGATNIEGGLQMAYQLAAKNFKPSAINRVILLTDGEANVGATGPDTILQTIHDQSAQGVLLSTIGFGMGDYNDPMLERLADTGNGNYAYVDTLDAARRIFVQNLTGTLQVIAKDAKVQVEFNPAVVASYRLIGYDNRAVADTDFRNDTVDAGEVGAGHSVTALYELRMTGQGQGTALTVQLRYADTNSGEVHEISQPFGSAGFGRDFAAAAPRFQQAVAVAGFAEQLRGSGMGATSLAGVLTITQRIAPQLANDSDMQEFAQLVERAIELQG
ncbi:MAG: von Willebrand factor type A domain-containing protein [Roseiflexaceae bacterium]